MLRKLLVLLLLCSGCQFLNPLAPIEGLIQLGVFWYEGDAHKYYHNDQATIEKSITAVLKELKIPIKERTLGSESKPTIKFKAGDGLKSYNIRIKYVNDAITLISIRVNTFGDHDLANLIFKYLDKQPGIDNFAKIEDLKAALHGATVEHLFRD